MASLPEDRLQGLQMAQEPDTRLLPDVLLAQAERRAAAAQLDIAKAQRLPTISLDASFNKAIGGVNPATMERNGASHTLMINLTSTLYQGGALDAQVRAATAAEEAATQRIETAQLNASDQARSFREQAVGARARMGVLTDRKRSIVRVRDLYREQYTLGTRSILDLLNAEQEIYQAAADEEAVRHDLWGSLVSYVGAAGLGREFYGLNDTTVQGMEVLR
jgi:adhesin transport system outer membrane protein